MNKPIDPENAVAVIKKDGREVGRVAVTAPNKDAYIGSFKGCTIEIVEDPDYAAASRMLGVVGF